MKFTITDGSHHDGVRNYVKGDIIESGFDLARLFPERFSLVEEDCPIPTEVVEESAKLAVEEPREDVANEPEVTVVVAKGDNVTARFPIAEECDLVVYRVGRYYFVYDKDNLSAPLNDNGLVLLKQDVTKFMEEYVSRS